MFRLTNMLLSGRSIAAGLVLAALSLQCSPLRQAGAGVTPVSEASAVTSVSGVSEGEGTVSSAYAGAQGSPSAQAYVSGTATACGASAGAPAHGAGDSSIAGAGTGLSACVAPPFIRRGDRVALIAPSYYASEDKVQSALDTLGSWGLVPVLGPNVGQKHLSSYAGTLPQRLGDLRWALHDPDIKAIFCVRGGYGTIHMVSGLTPADFSDTPKWLVGYSDITTLLSMSVRAGVMGIHGPMGTSFAGKDADTWSGERLRELMFGVVPKYVLPAHPQDVYGSAEGVLVGGNMCTLVPLLGSRADALACGDFILFVEEVGESLHNLDRLLNTMLLGGALDRCKGVILGQFTDCRDDLGCGGAETLFRSYLEPLGIPVCCAFPAGHDTPNLPLIMGAPVRLSVSPGGSTLEFLLDAPTCTVTPDGR